jgi:hypothetical protein
MAICVFDLADVAEALPSHTAVVEDVDYVELVRDLVMQGEFDDDEDIAAEAIMNLSVVGLVLGRLRDPAHFGNSSADSSRRLLFFKRWDRCVTRAARKLLEICCIALKAGEASLERLRDGVFLRISEWIVVLTALTVGVSRALHLNWYVEQLGRSFDARYDLLSTVGCGDEGLVGVADRMFYSLRGRVGAHLAVVFRECRRNFFRDEAYGLGGEHVLRARCAAVDVELLCMLQ